MREHFSNLTDYLYRVAHKLDLYVGIGAGIIFFAIAYFASIGEQAVVTVTLAIFAVSLFLSGYGVYREERQMRAEREGGIKVAVRSGSWAFNYPDPGPDKVSLIVHLFWEVWVNQDVSTDKLALNLIHVYDRPWWQFWKQTRFPQIGIPRKGKNSAQYRVMIYASDNQPFKDDGAFEYVGDRAEEGDPHWLLELVLITGMPVGEHRIPVSIDYEEMRTRGTNPPL